MTKKLKISAIVLSISIVLVSLGWFLGQIGAFNEWFSVAEINVEGNNYTSSEEIVKVSGLRNGLELYSLDLDSCGSEIVKLPYVKGVSISRFFPDEINIKIIEYHPVASIWKADKWILLSEEGTILPLIDEIDLGKIPVLNIKGKSIEKAGEKIGSASLKKGYSFVEELYNNHPVIYAYSGEINLTDEDKIEIFLIRSKTKIILDQADYKRQLMKLKYFLGPSENIDLIKNSGYVDLCFEERIIIKKA